MHDVPWLNDDGFLGAASYYDAQMEDHRLIMELLLMAKNEGGMIHNYSKVINIAKNNWGCTCDIQTPTGAVETVNAKSVISATGAWSNQFSQTPLVKPSKGVHIVLPEMNLPAALLLMTPNDQRVFFVMPWEGSTLVGTTDQYDDQIMIRNSYSGKLNIC